MQRIRYQAARVEMALNDRSGSKATFEEGPVLAQSGHTPKDRGQLSVTIGTEAARNHLYDANYMCWM
jgi:hypothetical protein